MRILKSSLAVAAAALLAVGLGATGADAKSHGKKAKVANTTSGGLVIWKKGKSGKCGTNFYFNKKRKMCHDSRWK